MAVLGRHTYQATQAQLMSRTAGLAALVALAMASQGCFDRSPQTTELAYGGPAEYAGYGYSNNPFAYDPFLFNYYCPLPYYYYSYYRSDGDRDCDDGFCGPRGGRRPPHRPLIASAPPAPVSLRESGVQETGESPAAAPAQWIGRRTLSSDGYSGNSIPSVGFGDHSVNSVPSSGLSGGGFHSVGGGGMRGRLSRIVSSLSRGDASAVLASPASTFSAVALEVSPLLEY
jgi:hypothetical protein